MKKSLFPKPRFGILRRLAQAQAGASAIEFAFVAPVLITFTFGILEFALAMGDYLRASEALRAATRVAAIQPAIADLSSLDETPATCSNSGSVSCSGFSINNAGSFSAILTEAQRILPDITASQLSVTYSSSGAGYSTTADGTAPMVTVRLSNYEHDLILQGLIPGVNTISFPDFSTSRIINY